MESPQVPQNDSIRLQALREFNLLDTLPEERFDRLTRLAQNIFGVEIALISLIDSNRQWFKSKQGLDACETDRDISFCGHAILGSEIFNISDALLDPRFADNPLVTGAPHIRFYAGAPLRPDGKNTIGTLCIIDSQPRQLSIKDLRILRDLADSVEQEIFQIHQTQQHQALLALTKISSLLEADYRQLLTQALQLAQDFLGMPNAMINRIRDNDCEILIQAGVDCSCQGKMVKLEDTLCSIIIEKNTLVLLPDVKKSAYAHLAKQSLIVINAYIGAPITIRGEPFGSLVFSSPDSHVPLFFSQIEVEFIQLFTEWLNNKIHEWSLDQSLESQEKLALAISSAQEKFIHGQDQSKGFNGLLQDILALSGCEFGFIGEIINNPTGAKQIKIFAESGVDERNDTTIPKYIDITEPADFFAIAASKNCVSIIDHVPDQHVFQEVFSTAPSLKNYLGIPIHYDNQLVAIIGLANRRYGFKADFIQFLDPILLTIGQLIQAARVQEQHTENKRRLADIIKGTNIGTWEWNVQTGQTTVNARWAEIIGYTLEEISPVSIDTWIQYAHPEDLQTSNELLKQHFNGSLDYYELASRMRHKDGHWVWVLDRGRLVSRTSDGKPLIMSGSHEDISEKKKAEAQLAHAYDLLEQSNTAARIGTWEIDIADTSAKWSTVTKDIHEVPLDYTCSMTEAINFGKAGKHQEHFIQLIQNALNEGIPFDAEIQILTYKKNERWVRIVGVSQFKNGVCERLYGTMQDISERKRIEKMKDEFISTVSHELRTPLTSISGSLTLMSNGVMGEIPEKIKTMLQIAQKNSQRLSLLINDLLDMEKISAGQLQFQIERLALAPILQTALESNAAAGIERMISFAIDNPYPEIQVAIDVQRFLQVLSNLLSNAIKYSPNHGHIQITVSKETHGIRITVKDQGPGIPLEFQSRIFQKFAQADSSDTRQRGGTGLGLAISKELTEAMHGSLHFQSTYGEGASFFIDLPLYTS